MKKEENFKSGYAAIIGKPNVGKSTLLNNLVMRKIAATSHKPQTTRNKITGVVHFPGGQIILLDTPGIHKASSQFNQLMVKASLSTYKDVDIISTTSDFFMPIMKSAFNNNQTFIAGQPRNDLFFQNNNSNIKKELGLQNHYIITYMPTHRKYGRGDQNPVIFTKNKEAEKYFNDKNIKVLIKLHPNMSSKMVVNNSSILNVTDLAIDTQELLNISDLLITDYSSCVVDYLLLDRPIIFYLYDDYEKVEENDLYFKLEDHAPGGITNNESQLLIEIDKAFSNEDYFLGKRQEMSKLFNKYNDGLSSERMYSLIKNLNNLNNQDNN